MIYISQLEYEQFLKSKELKAVNSGFECKIDAPYLFNWQNLLTGWSLGKGKSALFGGTGTGKTRIQLEWSRRVVDYTNGDVMILAPLAVSLQTHREGQKIGINTTVCNSQKDVRPGINITNYEKMDKFDLSHFVGIVLDESSLLKGQTGVYKQQLIDSCSGIPYRLCCTATPSPNDYMELGNHCEFLSVMSKTEMLATYFVHDGGDTSKWRLKGHAEKEYWKWVGTWSVMFRDPKDIGFETEGFNLPELRIHEHILESEADDGMLFAMPANTLNERRQARRDSMSERVKLASDLVNNSNDIWVVWCNLNDESAAITKAIKGCVEVKGSDKSEHKEKTAIDFADGKIKAISTKARIYGFGMNWQVCHKMIFCGISDSYEELYQAIRRCYRFGQKYPVDVHIIISEKEIKVLENIRRKELQLEKMQDEMIKYCMTDLLSTGRITEEYRPTKRMVIPDWLVSEC